MKLKKKYKIYLMHHSHTDIGYTKSPELTINEQVEYIRYIIDKLKTDKTYQNFKWVCESYIIVERFLNTATAAEIETFAMLVHLGNIEVTAMYANLAECLDANILERMIKRAKNADHQYQLNISTAMNADVNGLSKDYAKKLSQQGIHNYYIAVHTHHGMYPLFQKQSYFKWDLGDGDYLNVWNGEHYMFGNGFAFSKGAISVHGFFDDVDFKKYNLADDDSWIELAENRFEKYINQLEKDGYNYDFIPLTIHGKFTDNSMPNFDIINRVEAWNEKNDNQIEVIMCTLNQFFDVLSDLDEVPVYEGEWPDWWTDGVISAPAQLKLFKNAQTQYNKLLSLIGNSDEYQALCFEIDHNLTMYAEHTYGSFDSISNPYHQFTHRQWALKQNYLSNALRELDKLEHNVLTSLGKNSINHHVPTKFKVINSGKGSVNQLVQLPFGNSDADNLTGKYTISDEAGKVYDYVTTNDWCQFPIVNLELEGNSTKILNVESIVESNHEQKPYFSRSNLRGSDNVYDLNDNQSTIIYNANSIQNESLRLSWNENGITSIVDNGSELLDGSSGFLNVIYELSKVERHTLGRNRKGTDVIRAKGKLQQSAIIEGNKMYTIVKQDYQVLGFNQYTLYIKIFSDKREVEFKIQCEKGISAMIENVYLSLPFKNKEVYLGKTNSEMKVWEQQLPGTLTDYYAAFNGLRVGSQAIMTTPDTHLVQVGPLDNQNRVLYGDYKLNQIEKNYYIWLMSNYWETNFVKSLAGFYEFNFKLDLNVESKTIDDVANDLMILPIFDEE